MYANEIDNMALIMPSQDKKSGSASSDQREAAAAKKPKKMEITQSLNVACLRRCKQ